uniref:Ribosomal protein S13 n=1 Tax=Thraustochytrium aureum TaxID=42467 RepID=Q9G4D3_9STRA|nr:ribosomal protein S13 [Thraustochytrium aureum]
MISHLKSFKKNKTLFNVLRDTKSIGPIKIKYIAKITGLSLKTPISLFSESQLEHLSIWIEKNFTGSNCIHTEFLQIKSEEKKKIIASKSLRSLRFKKGLPVRGQRTKTNAKTAKRLNKGS